MNAGGRPLDVHALKTVRTGVRTLTWVDANFLDPVSASSPVIRIDGKAPVPVPLSGLGDDEDIRFRCAAGIDILNTPHFLGKAPLSDFRSSR